MTETTPKEVIDSLLLKIKSMGSEIDALMKVIETAQKGWNECSVKVTELTVSLDKMKEQRDNLAKVIRKIKATVDIDLGIAILESLAAIESPVKDSLTTASDIKSQDPVRIREVIKPYSKPGDPRMMEGYSESPDPVKDEACPECGGAATYKSIAYQGPPDNPDGTFDCGACDGTGRKAK